MKMSRNAGREVQNTSVWWDSSRNRLNIFIFIDFTIIMSVSIVMEMIKTIVWSWKNERCSIKGEFLFCIFIILHIGINL